ncbi:MAG: queuosine precursor transporter [Bacteroidales bacterium]|nr:queuosine precursor transporter [Bacteroidales bacterium]
MKQKVSVTFMMLCVLMTVCLISSNIFTTKVFTLWGLVLTGDLLIFPVSYIINDCISEVYGYRHARLSIWTAFLMNFFVVAVAQAVVAIPGADFWDGGEHFNYIFRTEIKVAAASLAAFFVGSTVNAAVMSLMKRASNGRHFWLRAIISSLAGDLADSLIFMPIVFWSVGLGKLLLMIACQILAKLVYEAVLLPLTQYVVKVLKEKEATDVIDGNISYNPFHILDI